jgi:hypothetical protein
LLPEALGTRRRATAAGNRADAAVISRTLSGLFSFDAQLKEGLHSASALLAAVSLQPAQILPFGWMGQNGRY